MSADPQTPSADDRLCRVETLLSHLQYDVDKLNEALIEQQAQIEGLKQLLMKVESVVDSLPDLPRDPGEERPPHY